MLIGIVGHVDRAHQARILQHSVGASYLSLDDGSMGCEANHRHVWDWLHTHRRHHDWLVVLEDDAKPCDGFREQLHDALNHAPAPVVSLYAGRQRPPQFQWALEQAIGQAENEDASWITSSVLMHAVAVAICTTQVTDMLATLAWMHEPIDESLSRWATRVAYTYPSLCDHLDGKTLINHRDGQPRPPGRTAWRHGTRPEWTARSVAMPL